MNKRKLSKGLRLPPSLDLLAKLVALANFATDERASGLEAAQQAEDDARKGMDLGQTQSVDLAFDADDKLRQVNDDIFRDAETALSTVLSATEGGALSLPRPIRKNELPRTLFFRRGEDIIRTARALRIALRGVAESLAEMKRQQTASKERVRLNGPQYGSLLKVTVPGVPHPALELAPGGVLHVHTDLIVQYLLPELDGLKAWRLAICEGCGVLYLRKKPQQRGCRQDCKKMNALYMREYRSEKGRARYAGNRRLKRILGFKPQPVKPLEMI